MEPDVLNVIETKDMKPKEKIKLEDKNLSQMTLFEHAQILDEMQEMIENNPDLTEEEKAVVDKINISAEKKALAWGYIISKLQEAQAFISNENDFYTQKVEENKARMQVIQNRIKPRAEYLQEIMIKLDKKKVEGPNYLVRMKKQTQVIEIKTDLEKIDYSKYPGCFKDIPQSYQPIKEEIKKWLKTNESEDFCLSEESYKLEVK